MNTIWSIRTGIRDFLEAIYRTCQSWIEKYPFIKTAYTIFSWLSLIMFVLSLFFVKESRTMMVQYLWSFYVLLQFWFLCRSKTMPWKQVVLFVLSGVFLVVPFTTLTVNALHALFGGKTSDTWSIAVITPIFEELWKLLPLGIFLLFSRRASALSLSDYTLIGAATGVGFQLMEELSRRWLSSGILAEKFGYSFTMLGGETIHWDFFSLFPGRFEESLFPTLMTVGHPLHTAMIALACGIAYRLRTRLTKWVFLFPVIILLWSILDHAAYNGQHQLPGWVFRIHDWTGSGYKTQPVFLLMLAASLFADYWSLNKMRNRLPSLPNAILPEVTLRFSDWIKLCPPTIVENISNATSIMAKGMADWALKEWRIRNEEDLDEYTFYVAGLVGVMLSDIWKWYDSVETDKDLAIAFGRGLQSVNILRNRAEDLERGVDFFPDGWELEDMFMYARRNLALADVYLKDIKPGPILNFCEIPLALAHGTLNALKEGKEKMSRATVTEIVSRVVNRK